MTLSLVAQPGPTKPGGLIGARQDRRTDHARQTEACGAKRIREVTPRGYRERGGSPPRGYSAPAGSPPRGYRDRGGSPLRDQSAPAGKPLRGPGGPGPTACPQQTVGNETWRCSFEVSGRSTVDGPALMDGQSPLACRLTNAPGTIIVAILSCAF